MLKLLKIPMALAALAMLGACATQSTTPRQTAMAAADYMEPALEYVAAAKEEGLLSASTIEAIERYGPDIRTMAGGAMSRARDCRVIDGNLETDPAANGRCSTSSVLRAVSLLKDQVYLTANAVGSETDAGIRLRRAGFAMGIAMDRLGDGLRTDYDVEDDVSLAEFDARMARLQFDADRLVPAPVAGQPLNFLTGRFDSEDVGPAPTPSPEIEPASGVPDEPLAQAGRFVEATIEVRPGVEIPVSEWCVGNTDHPQHAEICGS